MHRSFSSRSVDLNNVLISEHKRRVLQNAWVSSCALEIWLQIGGLISNSLLLELDWLSQLYHWKKNCIGTWTLFASVAGMVGFCLVSVCFGFCENSSRSMLCAFTCVVVLNINEQEPVLILDFRGDLRSLYNLCSAVGFWLLYPSLPPLVPLYQAGVAFSPSSVSSPGSGFWHIILLTHHL